MKRYLYLILLMCCLPMSVKAIDLSMVDEVKTNNQTFNNKQQINSPIAQLNQTEITEMVKAVTVKVSANNNRGTGTIIGKEGNKYLIITNFHVIRGNNNITIETADGDTHQAQLIENGISNKYDLALLEFTSENQYQKVEISPLLPKSLNLESPIIAGGYADETRQLKVTRGEIKQIADKPLKEGYEIGYSGEIVQGMSGGGIFILAEEYGMLFLIGINGRSSYPIINTAYVYEDGDKPSTAEIAKMREVNWGIAINTLLIYIKSEILTAYKLSLPEVTSEVKTVNTGYIAELEAKAKQFTVKIDSSSGGNGSGVIIAKEGKNYTVLTADHVLCEKAENATDKDPCLDYSYTITTYDGKTREINKSTIIREKGVDLAVFKFESEESYPVAEIANYNPNTDDFVFAAGFPKIGNNNPQWLFSGGRVHDKEQGLLQTRQSDLSNQQGGILQSVASLTGGYELVYTSITYGGMSGGAVLDSQGRVIGIHGRSEGAGGSGIQLGYSLGIPISTFMGLQERLKAKPQFLTTAKPQISQSQQQKIIKAIDSVIVPDTNATADIWIERGGQLWRLGRYEEAIKAFEEAIKQNNPENVYLAWYGKGLALSYLTQFQASLEALEKAINTLPDRATLSDNEKINLKEFHSYILIAQSAIYRYLSDYQQALTVINQALALSPNNTNYYNQKSVVLINLKRYDEALEAINQAIDLAPRSAWYLHRGVIYYQEQQWDSALADYSKALELDPKFSFVYNNRGNLYKDLQKYDLALADYNQAISINPNDAVAYANRGHLYVEQQKWNLALADYNKVIVLNPNIAVVYYNRGLIYQNEQKWDLALSDYAKAIELNPSYAEAYNNRGNLYKDLQKYDLALADYNQAISINPNDAVAYYNRGILYDDQQKWELALADYTKAIELNLNLAQVYYNRGILYDDQQKWELALADYTKAIELNPNLAQAHHNRGNLYQKQQKWELALSDYNKAIELDPNLDQAYLNRGNLYQKQQKWELALADYSKVIVLNPNDSKAYYNRGLLYYKGKKWELALADYSKAIALNPNLAQAYNNRGLVYAQLKQTQKAKIDLQKAAELFKQQGNMAAYEKVMQILQQLGG